MREREKEGAQPAKWDQCPRLDVARENEASKTEMPTSAAKERETANKRENAGVRDRQRERQRGSHLAETWQLAVARATRPPAALITRKPRRMESVKGEKGRERGDCRTLPSRLSTGTTKGCPQTTSSQTIPAAAAAVAACTCRVIDPLQGIQ